jgi:hypothetical protein
MTPLAIGALLAAAAMVWVIAPVFTDVSDGSERDRAHSQAADDAAEAAIREWRESTKDDS